MHIAREKNIIWTNNSKIFFCKITFIKLKLESVIHRVRNTNEIEFLNDKGNGSNGGLFITLIPVSF